MLSRRVCKHTALAQTQLWPVPSGELGNSQPNIPYERWACAACEYALVHCCFSECLVTPTMEL